MELIKKYRMMRNRDLIDIRMPVFNDRKVSFRKNKLSPSW